MTCILLEIMSNNPMLIWLASSLSITITSMSPGDRCNESLDTMTGLRSDSNWWTLALTQTMGGEHMQR